MPCYELKQGLLALDTRKFEDATVQKVINTICAIANNGKDHSGKVIIGVTDKVTDADRIRILDKITPKKVGRRFVVGIVREAAILKLTPEKYFARIKQAIQKSTLSSKLKASVLSNLDYNSFYGLGVIVITIPPQKEPSYVGDDLYWRNGDATEKATGAKMIAEIALRFS